MKKAIATSWHPGGVNAIVPVIRRLKEEGNIHIVTLGHQYSEQVFRENDMECKTIGDYGLDDISPISMDKLLHAESPDLVFTGTSVQDKNNAHVIEQTLTLAAQETGIKSLSILDFWGNYSERFSDIYDNNGKFKFLPSIIAVMDRIAEESMINEGFDGDIIKVTGNPYFDELVRLGEDFSEEDMRAVRADLGIDDDAYLILYASQPIEYHYGQEFGYTEKTAMRELLESLEKLSNMKTSVLVKVHPREDMSTLEEASKGYELHIVVDKQYPIREAILASDAVVSPFSTVLIESSYITKPSISLQPGLKRDDLLITNKLGVTVPVYNHGEIGSVFERLFFDEDYVAKLSEMRKNFLTDGNATNRVTKLVYEMIG